MHDHTFYSMRVLYLPMPERHYLSRAYVDDMQGLSMPQMNADHPVLPAVKQVTLDRVLLALSVKLRFYVLSFEASKIVKSRVIQWEEKEQRHTHKLDQ